MCILFHRNDKKPFYLTENQESANNQQEKSSVLPSIDDVNRKLEAQHTENNKGKLRNTYVPPVKINHPEQAEWKNTGIDQPDVEIIKLTRKKLGEPVDVEDNKASLKTEKVTRNDVITESKQPTDQEPVIYRLPRPNLDNWTSTEGGPQLQGIKPLSDEIRNQPTVSSIKEEQKPTLTEAKQSASNQTSQECVDSGQAQAVDGGQTQSRDIGQAWWYYPGVVNWDPSHNQGTVGTGLYIMLLPKNI